MRIVPIMTIMNKDTNKRHVRYCWLVNSICCGAKWEKTRTTTTHWIESIWLSWSLFLPMMAIIKFETNHAHTSAVLHSVWASGATFPITPDDRWGEPTHDERHHIAVICPQPLRRQLLYPCLDAHIWPVDLLSLQYSPYLARHSQSQSNAGFCRKIEPCLCTTPTIVVIGHAPFTFWSSCWVDYCRLFVGSFVMPLTIMHYVPTEFR